MKNIYLWLLPFILHLSMAHALELNEAVRKGDVAKVKSLILANKHAASGSQFDINWKDGYGQTSFVKASKKNNVVIMALLLDAKADINARDRYQRTALYWAYERHHREAWAFLLTRADINLGADHDNNPVLTMASRSGRVNAIISLLIAKADINARNTQNATALYCAVRSRQRQSIETLLKARASVDDIQGTNDYTALSYMSRFGKLSDVQILLNAKANINAIDQRNRTALVEAVEAKRPKIWRFLLDAKADINIATNNGQTVFLIAASLGSKEVINALLKENRESIAAVDNAGETAPMLALKQSDILLELLDSGADISAKNNQGYSILHLAINNKSKKTIASIFEWSLSHQITLSADDVELLEIHKICTKEQYRQQFAQAGRINEAKWMSIVEITHMPDALVQIVFAFLNIAVLPLDALKLPVARAVTVQQQL